MDAAIRQLVLHLQSGGSGIESALRVIETQSTWGNLHCFIQALLLQEPQDGDVYTLFIALKLYRFVLTRRPNDWIESNGEETVDFLLECAKQICHRKRVLRPCVQGAVPVQRVVEWRPVFSELGATIAVALKLRCAMGQNFYLENVTKGLLSLSVDSPGEPFDSEEHVAEVVLRRCIIQRTVEEFGLFDKPSRRRGIPVRQHIFWRKKMEEQGLLDLTEHFGNVVLRHSSIETVETLHAALCILFSGLSWFKHRFVDADEEAAEEETTDTFEVNGPRWRGLLLGSAATPSDPVNGLAFVLLNRFNEFVCSQGIQEAVDLQRKENPLLSLIVQCIRLVCSYHIVDLPAAMDELFVSSHFTLCLNMLQSCAVMIAQGGVVQEMYKEFLPVIANGVKRLISNFSKVFLTTPFQPQLMHFVMATKDLLELSAQACRDHYWGSVEELLSGWLTLTFLEERSGPCDNSETLFACTAQVLEAFLSRMQVFRVWADGVDAEDNLTVEDQGHFLPVEQTCFQMAGRVGRVTIPTTCGIFRASLAELVRLLVIPPGQHQELTAAGSGSSGATVDAAFSRAVSAVLRLLLSYVADPSEGEQPYIPRCFLDVPPGELGVVRLLIDVRELYPVMASSPCLKQLPSVYEAYCDVLERYIRVYIEAEETIPLYSESFDHGVELLDFAVTICTDFLLLFPLTESDAVTNLFSAVTDKSAVLREMVTRLPSFTRLLDLVKDESSTISAINRGRFAACAATCISPVDLFAGVPQLSQLLTSHAREENIVYNADCLTGMAQFLKRADALQSQFASYVVVAENVMLVAFSELASRSTVLHALNLARNMFTAFSIAVEDSQVQRLLRILQATLLQCTQSLESAPMWKDSEEAVNDRVQLLQSMATLLYDIALWKTLDCFLSDLEIAHIIEVTLSTLAFLLQHITAEERDIPELNNALFNALENCANAFTAAFVSHPMSHVFFDAIVFAAQHQEPSIQLVGIHLMSTVSSSPLQHKEELFVHLVQLLLHVITHGQTTFRNTKHLCRGILKICRSIPIGRIDVIFQLALQDDPAQESVLRALYTGLAHASQQSVSDSEAFPYFEEITENAIAAMDILTITSNA